MNDSWRDWIPPHRHWDAVLRLLPAHIFLFDSTLICRYAAPAGETFLGRSQAQLTGRHAAEILPPVANGLGLVLERATQEPVGWSTPHYRYSHRLGDAEIAYVWAIEVEPFAVAGQQGVLVTLRDVLELVEERDRLRLENDDLAQQLHRLRESGEERERGLARLGSHLRTQLTAVWGNLQILERQPDDFEGRSVARTINELVLPPLREVIQATGDLEYFPRGDSEKL